MKVVLICVMEVYMKKTSKSLIFMLCIILIVSGCSKEEKKNDTASNTESVYASDVIVNADKLYDVLGAEDVWKETVSDVNLYAEINVQVEVPDVNNMMVIKTEPKVYTSEEKKNILLDLTENQVYKYDEEFVPKEDIQLEIDKTEELIEYYSGNTQEAKDNREYYEKLLGELNDRYSVAPEDYIVADSCEGNKYLISRNDIKYVVEFNSFSDLNGLAQEKSSIYIYLLDVRNLNEDKQYDVIGVNDWVRDDWITEENITTITEEEAKEIAVEFATQIADGNFVVYDSYPLKWYGRDMGIITEDYWYDGYVVNLCRTISGVEVDYNQYYNGTYYYDETTGEKTSTNGGHGLERLHICVTTQGVISLSYENPYIVGNTEVGAVEILPFSTVKECIVGELSTGMYYNGEVYKYMDLIYYPIRDYKTNEYLYIPVWRLVDDKFGWITQKYILINAMDGSIINAVNQTTIE